MRNWISRLTSPMLLAIVALLALIGYTALMQWSASAVSGAQVVKGRAHYGGDSSSRLALTGQWRVYWGELLAPEQLHDDFELGWMPSRWRAHPPQVSATGPVGRATYAVDIHFERPPTGLGLQLPRIYRAAKLWGNGQLLAQIGRPGTTAAEERPREAVRLLRLPQNVGEHLRLVLQVSSADYHNGGMHQPVIIDQWQALVDAERWRVLRGLFLMSATFTLALYLLLMWAHAQAGREYLYLGLGLFWYCVRLFGTEKLIYYVYPDFSADWLLRAEYFGLFLCVPAYLLFIQAIYPRDISARAMGLYWYLGVAASVLTCVWPPGWFSYMRAPYELLSALYLLYFIYCLITVVWRRRRWSAWVGFLGGIIALLFVNEVLYYREVVEVHLTPWMFVFVALTSIIFLGQRINVLLHVEAEQKAALQRAVEERTFELQRRLEELDQARRHALELAHKRSEFMAELSHEIRTPLSGLIGALRLIGRGDQGGRGLVGHAIEAGESLLYVVGDALSGERYPRSLQVVKEPFDMIALARSVTELMGIEADNKGLAVRLKLAPSLGRELWIEADRQKIRQVLTNLMHNGIKFTACGEVCLSLAAQGDRGEPGDSSPLTLELRVADSGVGIEPAHCDRVFHEYVQLDAQASGAGLGLAITRRLVTTMGGRIELDSEPGRGSTFIVHLPVIGAARQSRPSSECDTPDEPLDARDVLVVEDDPVNRAIVIELLRLDGHRVDSVGQALDALERLQAKRFDLCLLDIRLPDINGMELLARVRAINAHPLPLFVALTANTSDADIAQYRSVGFDYVMEKPVDKVHLRRVLARCARPQGASDAFFLRHDMLDTGSNETLVDRSQWQGIVNDLGRERAQELLADAEAALYQYVGELERALGEGNLQEIQSYAHKIKSAARSVGMISVATIAHHVEADPSRAFSALSNFGSLIATSRAHLQT